jgi:hypothetical protein
VALSGGCISGIPPKIRGRDSLAITFLDADFMTSAVKLGMIARPGVAAFIGDPFPVGVVPRDSAMLAAASTSGPSSVTRELDGKSSEE